MRNPDTPAERVRQAQIALEIEIYRDTQRPDAIAKAREALRMALEAEQCTTH